ncbi:hypothetical protein HPB49_012863 [Dermacentor silvarum]|uniref:Uncharacterized protein n=1 Tax=Dermacentor silvarum TaxID=543639 RepID=A0ACB8DIU0_DERSI|nr:hypothetical protein HPB49_012863 [Dermacentor silvarum]
MQGICDSNGRFEDVFTGTPSKIHDARVLRLSNERGSANNLPNQPVPHSWRCCLSNTGTPSYTIQRFWCHDRCADCVQPPSLFNVCVIENAFSSLKQRFRQLRYIEFQTVDKITQFIIACCTLHNICLDVGDLNVDDILTDDDLQERQQEIAQHRILREEECKEASQSIPTQRESALRRLGELKRSNLAQRLYFAHSVMMV